MELLDPLVNPYPFLTTCPYSKEVCLRAAAHATRSAGQGTLLA